MDVNIKLEILQEKLKEALDTSLSLELAGVLVAMRDVAAALSAALQQVPITNSGQDYTWQGLAWIKGNMAFQGNLFTLTSTNNNVWGGYWDFAGQAVPGEIITIPFSGGFAGSPKMLSHTIAQGETVKDVVEALHRQVINDAQLKGESIFSEHDEEGPSRLNLLAPWYCLPLALGSASSNRTGALVAVASQPPHNHENGFADIYPSFQLKRQMVDRLGRPRPRNAGEGGAAFIAEDASYGSSWGGAAWMADVYGPGGVKIRGNGNGILLQDLVCINGDLFPEGDGQYMMGLPSRRYKEIHVKDAVFVNGKRVLTEA